MVRTAMAAGLVAFTACGGGMTTGNNSGERLPALADVSTSQWAALAQRQIFFGHQSVGGNIMAGVADVMARHPAIGLNLVESRDLKRASAPAFHHALVGRNDYPIEKLDDFVAISSTGFGEGGGIAMLKFCYVDIHKQTDAHALFAEYQQRVDALKANNPSLTIVHFTTPLTGIENWKGRVRAAITGNATARERNVVRNRYNDLVRRAYEGREPLFDIANLESTLPDGRRAFFGNSASPTYILAPEYTDDGGHLNAAARRMVAEQLLIMLARLQPASVPASRIAAGSAR